jgi:peroxiredoxin Q/BCP
LTGVFGEMATTRKPAAPAKTAAPAGPAAKPKAAPAKAAAAVKKAPAPKAEAPAAAGPAEGAPAPAFRMPASGGRTVSSEALKGKAYLLYFYPKADTPGCTKQACGVQEALPQLGKLGLEVIGVSPDPVKPIEKFAEKYRLTFPLASDEDHKVAEVYGTWVEKSMYGRTYMGMERSSFLVGPDGVVRKVWRKVKPEAHAAEVMEAAKAVLG